MAPQCNIDGRGKAVRLIGGILFLLAGIAAVLLWAGPTGRVAPWVISCTFVFAGAFMIFEARAGWCVVRAMGFKTPL
jgi:hypothetical protein